jgi:beta-glucosidase
LNKVLRDEWGFHGFVLSDFAEGGYMNAAMAIRNGNDAILITYDTGANNVTDRSATSLKAMRQVSKNIMYTVVNSRAYNGTGHMTQSWQLRVIIIDIIILVVLAGVEFLIIRNNRVGGHPLLEWPSSHTTVRTVRYTAVQ